MANRETNLLWASPQETILEKIEHFVIESRVSSFQRYQLPIECRSIQYTEENKNLTTHYKQNPIVGGQGLSASRHSDSHNTASHDSFHFRVPSTPPNVQSTGAKTASPSNHDQPFKAPRPNVQRTQPRSDPQTTQNVGVNKGLALNPNQIPRGPRGNFVGLHVPVRVRQFEKSGGQQSSSTPQDKTLKSNRQTARSQHFYNRRVKNYSANKHQNPNTGTNQRFGTSTSRGKGPNAPWDGKSSIRQNKGRQDQNWNPNLSQNPKFRHNQHAGGKFIPGRKNPKVGNHDDWRHEDAINDEDLARWYE